MRQQTRYTLLAVVAVLLGLAAVLYLRWKAPPEAARLLPESDAVVYVNLKPVRLATHFDHSNVVKSTTYQQFIDATGIVPERDLDSAAFALHKMSDPRGPNGLVAYSEVFKGRFDAGRLAGYLAGVATGTEEYAGHTIYAVPSEGRTLRVAVLGYDMVAASNMPTPEQIHSMLDRERAGASPFAGSSLLNARYGDVPAFSMAWGLGKVGLPFSEDGQISALGVRLPLAADATLVASVKYEGAVLVRVEELTAGEDEAERSAEALSRFLGVLKVLAPMAGNKDGMAAKEVVDSMRVEQKKERVVILAKIPDTVLKQVGR